MGRRHVTPGRDVWIENEWMGENFSRSKRRPAQPRFHPRRTVPTQLSLIPIRGPRGTWTSWEEDSGIQPPAGQEGSREEVLSPGPRLLPAEWGGLHVCGWPPAWSSMLALLSLPLTRFWSRGHLLRARLVWMRSAVKLDPRSLQLMFQAPQSTKRETFVQISRIF